MSRVLFIRHAETEMAGRYCGHSDPDLNAQGRAQLTRLTQSLTEEILDTVYSSDLRRAASTAQAIAGRHIPQVLRPALREIDFGDWEGMKWEEIERLDPVYAQKWVSGYPHLRAPSGESFEDFERRVLTEVNHLMDRSPALSRWLRMEACCVWSYGICAATPSQGPGKKPNSIAA
jgi:broad specificity phosphatase PhoE